MIKNNCYLLLPSTCCPSSCTTRNITSTLHLHISHIIMNNWTSNNWTLNSRTLSIVYETWLMFTKFTCYLLNVLYDNSRDWNLAPLAALSTKTKINGSWYPQWPMSAEVIRLVWICPKCSFHFSGILN